VRGRVHYCRAESPEELLPGDYISYPGDAAHIFEALTPDIWATLRVEHR